MASQVDTIVECLGRAGFAFKPDCPWLESVETAFTHQLPEPYRSLLQSFRFAAFEVPGCECFSNLGVTTGFDITDAPFMDPALREWLIPRGYLQIGRPEFANYDPICFDMQTHPKSPQIIRLDHEDILLQRKRVKSRLVAESFMALVDGAA